MTSAFSSPNPKKKEEYRVVELRKNVNIDSYCLEVKWLQRIQEVGTVVLFCFTIVRLKKSLLFLLYSSTS